MLINYVIVSLRNLRRGKLISAVNLLGLALGIAFTLLILLWVEDERNVDAFHADGDRIYNIFIREYADGKVAHDYSTPGLLASELKKKMPEVEYAVAYDNTGESAFQHGEKKLKYEGYYANEDFLKVFSFPLLYGDVNSALTDPSSITLSRKMATAFYGSAEEAIGKTIRFRDRDNFTITAVFDDVLPNSTLQFDFLINWHIFMKQSPWFVEFGNTGPSTTVKLKANADPSSFRTRIKNFIDDYDVGQGPAYKWELDIQRYDEHYLYSSFKNGHIDGGRIQYVYLFTIVAAFILIIACINFMNLSTARSLKRSREIGVRKVVGAGRGTLVSQFMTEALLLAFMALAGAIIIVSLSLPAFNALTSKSIYLPWNEPVFWVKLFVIALVSGLLAGIYPALYISSFDTVKAVKGNLKFRTQAILFRKGLIVFQFVLSILLIVSTIVVSKQINYIQKKSLGYDRENLLLIRIEGNLIDNYPVFKIKAESISGVVSVSRLSAPPFDIDSYTTSVEWQGKDPISRPSFAQAAVGYDFIRTMKAELVEGRDFSREFGSDSASFLVNESAARRMGLEQPVGSPVKFWDMNGTIIGVVKDFHFRSLHEPIVPLILRLGEKDQYGAIMVRTAPGKLQEIMSSLQSLCENLNPNFPFSVHFTDEEYQQLYKSEAVIGTLSKYFSALAILISCMGLLGLVVFSAQQRTREIGIRKVLGASVNSIFTLLSKEFMLLVIIAILIATPLAWWVSSDWLASFEYKVDVEWWMFVVASLLTLSIALLTVGAQAIKSALSNPVKSLRSE